MPPHRLACGHPVTGDDLVAAALLLRVEEVAVHGERRPAGSDRATPQLHRRRLRPVGRELHAANHAVALRPAEARPFRAPRRCRGSDRFGLACRFGFSRRRGGRWKRFLRYLRCDRRRRGRLRPAPSSVEGFVDGLREKQLLGSLRPPQVEIRPPVGVDATSPEQDPRQASEHYGDDRRGASCRGGESTAHRRPADQRDAQGRDRKDVAQVAHRAAGDRRMDDILFGDHRGDYQNDRAQALVPARAAEEQPPHDDDERAPERPEHRKTGVLGDEDGDDIAE